jgi:hypothetical protein
MTFSRAAQQVFVSLVVLGAARLKILPSDLETCAAANASLKGNTAAAAAKTPMIF